MHSTFLHVPHFQLTHDLLDILEVSLAGDDGGAQARARSLLPEVDLPGAYLIVAAEHVVVVVIVSCAVDRIGVVGAVGVLFNHREAEVIVVIHHEFVIAPKLPNTTFEVFFV